MLGRSSSTQLPQSSSPPLNRCLGSSVVSRPVRLSSGMQSDQSTHKENEELLGDIERIRAHQDSYPDVLQAPLHNVQRALKALMPEGASQTAQDTIDWLRRALKDPEDYSASAIGRMVSKEYGRHEKPHTEHHLWRTNPSPHATPPSSPLGSRPAAAPQTPAATAAACEAGQAAGPATTSQGSGFGDAGCSSPTPPSGPGFLLHRDQDK